ncbi:hypothetical protein [Laspinema olomoucense]|uniref:hypothetical protein n=1 Tax=Laspinema olomoucense TaxID=3231600 RepID=UPI003F494219
MDRNSLNWAIKNWHVIETWPFPSPCGEWIGIHPILLKPLHYLVFKVRSRQSTESQLYKT